MKSYTLESYYNELHNIQKREDRIISEAEWYIDNRTSIRDVADNFMISKSTVYDDFTIRLKALDYDLYKEAMSILHYNNIHSYEKMIANKSYNKTR